MKIIENKSRISLTRYAHYYSLGVVIVQADYKTGIRKPLGDETLLLACTSKELSPLGVYSLVPGRSALKHNAEPCSDQRSYETGWAAKDNRRETETTYLLKSMPSGRVLISQRYKTRLLSGKIVAEDQNFTRDIYTGWDRKETHLLGKMPRG